MRDVNLAHEEDFDGWRAAARALVLEGIAPDRVTWRVGSALPDLFGGGVPPADAGPAFSVPRNFVALARAVICHADGERFALLHAMLARLRHEPGVIKDAADPMTRRLALMAQAVRRDIHKMRAFVRFREVGEGEARRFVAWFEPTHHIVRTNADFFARRFTNMAWSILTPEQCVHWDGEALSFTPGATRDAAPADDPVEAIWGSYYAAIFNPARLKPGMMMKEMPKKYWANMPETALIPELIAGAQRREADMVAASAGRSGANSAASLDALREEAATCTRCHLHRNATRTVFGQGPVDAPLMLVGEQPGDQEDLAGRPFVGPAGQLLDRALEEAGVDRARAYVTNAVKHFKFEQRGKRRIHAKPETPEIEACRWWLDQERALIRPAVTIALGVTAARALLGRTVTIERTRGAPIPLADGGECWVTVHPSFLLRLPDRDRAEQEYRRFVSDLRAAAAAAVEPRAG
jgi:DNA polymerase